VFIPPVRCSTDSIGSPQFRRCRLHFEWVYHFTARCHRPRGDGIGTLTYACIWAWIRDESVKQELVFRHHVHFSRTSASADAGAGAPHRSPESGRRPCDKGPCSSLLANRHIPCFDVPLSASSKGEVVTSWVATTSASSRDGVGRPLRSGKAVTGPSAARCDTTVQDYDLSAFIDGIGTHAPLRGRRTDLFLSSTSSSAPVKRLLTTTMEK
jgi:hypothetical protein